MGMGNGNIAIGGILPAGYRIFHDGEGWNLGFYWAW